MPGETVGESWNLNAIKGQNCYHIFVNDREMNIHYLGQEGDWDSEWGDGEKFIWITKEKFNRLPHLEKHKYCFKMN